jgi:excisionase family DNA binding protein
MPRTGVLGQATRIDPLPADHDALDDLNSRGDLAGDELVLRGADGSEIRLPESLVRLVKMAAASLAAGQAVMAIPAEVTLTPAEVAELLGLSRPFVGKLLDRGAIPSEVLPESSHRRVKLADVLAFQAKRDRRAEGTRRMVDIATSAGLPYLRLGSMARIFVDTNVLFPISLMDMMFSLNDDEVHEVLWTDHLLDEWERVIVREHQRSPDAAAAIASTVREFLADGKVPAEA